jgi:hypothetical protein
MLLAGNNYLIPEGESAQMIEHYLTVLIISSHQHLIMESV